MFRLIAAKDWPEISSSARSDRWGWGVFLNPLLARQFCGNLDDIAMALLSLDLGGGLSVDSVCHLRDRPALAIHRTFYELFSNAPHFADALRIVLVNRLCEHNSQFDQQIAFRPAAGLAGCRIVLFSTALLCNPKLQ
jgi:hypothetical protein